ncbi:MAG: aconitase family protein, partial [Planctomycetia bacterium]
EQRGFGLAPASVTQTTNFDAAGTTVPIGHGAVVIAAITSCTNTSNPSVMVAAGLVAKKAHARGLKVKPWVKTSLAPGSRVVTSYLDSAGLSEPLDALGFQTVGYGCTTCIGNSGPLPDAVTASINQGNLVAAAVLSGNRNFEGRVHPSVKANYLASPPLVVAYALAGSVDVDLQKDPLGVDQQGKPVYLKDVWPTDKEVAEVVEANVRPEMFRDRYGNVMAGNADWNAIPASSDQLYAWNEKSTYIQEPPFFQNLSPEPTPPGDVVGARVLLKVGDSVTTDHISPAGSIKTDSPAGKYLVGEGVSPSEFNSYGARRGNDRVMTRGTFANIRLRNQLVPGSEGNITVHLPTNATMPIYDAAEKYRADGTPVVVLAGAEYG